MDTAVTTGILQDNYHTISEYHKSKTPNIPIDIVEAFNYLNIENNIQAEDYAHWLFQASVKGFIDYNAAELQYRILSLNLYFTGNEQNFIGYNEADWYSLVRKLNDSSERNTGVELETEADVLYQGIKEPITPFDVGSVNIATSTMVLSNIISRLKQKEIDLDTAFQRGQNLWDDIRQSRLIESILVKFPLPAFYFDISNDAKWLVIDGLQRISTIKNFVADEKLVLRGLEFLTEAPFDFNGKKFSDLPRDFQRRIEETTITTYQIQKGTPDEVKFNLFKRINTGGLVLSAAEIRHALNQGPVSVLLKELAENKAFRIATDYSISDSRMEDRDFVVRFIAFYIIPYSNYGKKGFKADLDGYINQALGILKQNLANDVEYDSRIKNDFKKAMDTCFAIFGRYCFRKQTSFWFEARRKPINKALFEVLSSFLAQKSDADCKVFILKQSEIRTAFAEKMEAAYFYDSFSVGTGDTRRVLERHTQIQNIFNSVL